MKVTIKIRGPLACGKTRTLQAIEQLLKSNGIPVLNPVYTGEDALGEDSKLKHKKGERATTRERLIFETPDIGGKP